MIERGRKEQVKSKRKEQKKCKNIKQGKNEEGSGKKQVKAKKRGNENYERKNRGN